MEMKIMMPWGDYNWGWGMGFGWLFMIVFWVMVLFGIAYVIKRITGGAKEEETALDILKKRYAKGELTKDEYDRMKDDLLKH